LTRFAPRPLPEIELKLAMVRQADAEQGGACQRWRAPRPRLNALNHDKHLGDKNAACAFTGLTEFKT